MIFQGHTCSHTNCDSQKRFDFETSPNVGGQMKVNQIKKEKKRKKRTLCVF